MSAPSSAHDSDDIDASAFWIFGYSSLCWNPGFIYTKTRIGYVKGFSRKFWQGSVSHRGTKGQPGRVATLIEDNSAVVWGCAFKITPESSAFRYLQTRECSNGGYMPETVTFYPDGDESKTAIQVLTFIAYSDNCLWLGEAPLHEISSQIITCEGFAGHNVEYLLKLARYMRENIPQEKDEELFELEKLVLEDIKRHELNLGAMLVGCKGSMALEKMIEDSNQPTPCSCTSPANDFTHRIPDKKLRCVNI